MSNSIPQLTVDTIVVTDWTRPITRYLKKRLDASKQLLNWYQAGQVHLWYCPGERQLTSPDQMMQLAAQVSIGAWKNGFSLAACEADHQAEATIQRILKPGAFMPAHRHSIDGHLLLDHVQHQRHYFVSGDRQVLNAGQALHDALGITVINPLAMVQILQEQWQ